MKRTISRKSHSWWWDSHINPKNSRWLFENLEQMDRLIKEMLKLIEEEGDTFAKKAEMYYQRRPKLLAHVEDFYRMYRALAERYDNVTGELRKNMPSDLQSQSSGNGSDIGTDSLSPSFSPKRKKNHPKSSSRAAGFDVFLGSRKDSDDSPSSSSSSSSETGSDSEDGKVENAEDHNTSGLNGRIIQLEEELREVREKLKECNKSGFNEHQEQEDKIRPLMEAVDVAAKKFEHEISLKNRIIEEYKAQIAATLTRLVDEKSILEVEQEQWIGDMKTSEEISEGFLHENSMQESKVCSVKLPAQLNQQIDGDHELEVDILTSKKDEFDVRESRLTDSENILKAEIQALENRVPDLEAEKAETCNECDISVKLVAEVNKCLNLYKLKVEVLTSEKDDLNATVRKILDLTHIHEAKVKDLENQLKELEAANAEACDKSVKSIVELNQSMDIYKLKVDILTSENNRVRELEEAKAGEWNESTKHIDELYQSLDRYKLKVDKLTSEKDEVNAIVSGLIESKCIHDANVQVLENRVRELEAAKDETFNENMKHIDELYQSLDRYKLKVEKLTSEKDEVNAIVNGLTESKCIHDANVQVLENRVRELEAAKDGTIIENTKHIDELNQSLDRYKQKVDMLLFEKDELKARVSKLMDDAKCWDANSSNVAEHLHHLHMEHINLIREIEETREISTGLMNRVQELEEQVEKQKVLILDGAEEKREAIRQLCFSLEHYRNGYQKLRQMLQGHSRRLAIMAT